MVMTRLLMVLAWIGAIGWLSATAVSMYAVIDDTADEDSRCFSGIWLLFWIVGFPVISWILTGDALAYYDKALRFLFGGAL